MVTQQLTYGPVLLYTNDLPPAEFAGVPPDRRKCNAELTENDYIHSIDASQRELLVATESFYMRCLNYRCSSAITLIINKRLTSRVEQI